MATHQTRRSLSGDKVAAVDAMTGVITLDRPLGNTYLSTWPNYNQGNNFEADNGGPATIWAVDDTWNTTVEYRGLTINQEGQTYSPGRNVTYRDVTFGGGHGGIPTQNETWSAINTSFANVNLEVDKLIGTMTMDGVTIKQIVFQSSSTDLFIMKNSTVTNRLDGGGKRTEITDSKLNNFGPGIWAYGGTNGATICTRCNITTFNFDFGIFHNDNPSPYSMSGGVISFPNTAASGSGLRSDGLSPVPISFGLRSRLLDHRAVSGAGPHAGCYQHLYSDQRSWRVSHHSQPYSLSHSPLSAVHLRRLHGRSSLGRNKHSVRSNSSCSAGHLFAAELRTDWPIEKPRQSCCKRQARQPHDQCHAGLYRP